MIISELLQTAINAILSNKPRAALTMLGIIIGIASVIALVAIGNGSQSSITNAVSQLGTNVLTITAGSTSSGLVRSAAGSSSTLTLKDADAIQNSVSNIDVVSPEISRSFQVLSSTKNTNTTVYGVVPAYADVHDFQIAEGRYITQDDINNNTKVAVIGPTTQTNLFGTADAVGQMIKINGIPFTVVGITQSKGSLGSFLNQDDVIFVPLPVGQLDLFGQRNVRTISVKMQDATIIDIGQTEITSLLLSRHKISDPTKADFTISSSADTLSTLSTVTSTFTTLLAGIAGISLVVGGIGIMNIMLVTVTERTREVGLRKAVGAENSTILSQFLVEAVVLTMLGGLIGVAGGIGIASLVSALGIIQSVVSIPSIILAFGVSALVGVVFGLYPAYKASRLSPIEALRYE